MTPTDDFISDDPRPKRRTPSSLTTGSYGPERQASGSDTGTVSRWPFIAIVGPAVASPIEAITLGRFGSLAVTVNARPRAAHQSVTNVITSSSSPEGLGIAMSWLAILMISSRSTRSVQPF